MINLDATNREGSILATAPKEKLNALTGEVMEACAVHSTDKQLESDDGVNHDDEYHK